MKHALFFIITLAFSSAALSAPSDVCQETAFDQQLYGLCQAYTHGVNCLESENRDHQRCVTLRRNFDRHSGGQNIDDLLNGGGTSQIK